MRAKCIMVLGTTSGAGKSWLTTALCRWYAQRGYRVAPFKAQNMSNNARVVASNLLYGAGAGDNADGQAFGEIGSAQYFQSLAAKAIPELRMNPLLLKPEADTRSQVVLMGKVNSALSNTPWRDRSEVVWPVIKDALDSLRENFDVVVIEGAGSPAEINLHDSDIVNMRVALHAQAQCLLVTDIDRGGAFAHLYGTWALLPAIEQDLISGFVLNKFRGDQALLAPAPEMLEKLTKIPIVACLPMWWQHGLPEEDGLFHEYSINPGPVDTVIAVVAFPRISNLDEFQTLRNMTGVKLKWVRSPAELMGVDWIILPGSKHTSSDLQWLKDQGLDKTIKLHADTGKRVLGVCGGLQMLGAALVDPHGIDGDATGLNLLPLVTIFESEKTVIHTQSTFAKIPGPWSALSNVDFTGYEIHNGQTRLNDELNIVSVPNLPVSAIANNLGWCNANGNVLGVYVHGLFENDAVLQALFGTNANSLESVFDGLANFIDLHFKEDVLMALLQPKAKS